MARCNGSHSGGGRQPQSLGVPAHRGGHAQLLAKHCPGPAALPGQPLPHCLAQGEHPTAPRRPGTEEEHAAIRQEASQLQTASSDRCRVEQSRTTTQPHSKLAIAFHNCIPASLGFRKMTKTRSSMTFHSAQTSWVIQIIFF